MSDPQDTVGSPAGALPVLRVCVDAAFASPLAEKILPDRQSTGTSKEDSFPLRNLIALIDVAMRVAEAGRI